MHSILTLSALLVLLSTTLALPPRRLPSPLALRGDTPVDPTAVTGTVCNDASVALISHDTNVAILSICGGIAGTIEFCGGNPSTTIGASGTSKFTLTVQNAGATINVSKGRWEHCVAAAQAVCPTGTFSSTCVGGTTDGDFDFDLSANESTCT